MAQGNWNPEVIKPNPRCRLCGRVVKTADFVRLDGVNPAHRACAQAKGRTYTEGTAIQPDDQHQHCNTTTSPMNKLLNRAQAEAMMSAMAAMNNVGGRLHACIDLDWGGTLHVNESVDHAIHIWISPATGTAVGTGERHSDQNAFAAYYGV